MKRRGNCQHPEAKSKVFWAEVDDWQRQVTDVYHMSWSSRSVYRSSDPREQNILEEMAPHDDVWWCHSMCRSGYCDRPQNKLTKIWLLLLVITMVITTCTRTVMLLLLVLILGLSGYYYWYLYSDCQVITTSTCTRTVKLLLLVLILGLSGYYY